MGWEQLICLSIGMWHRSTCWKVSHLVSSWWSGERRGSPVGPVVYVPVLCRCLWYCEVLSVSLGACVYIRNVFLYLWWAQSGIRVLPQCSETATWFLVSKTLKQEWESSKMCARKGFIWPCGGFICCTDHTGNLVTANCMGHGRWSEII